MKVSVKNIINVTTKHGFVGAGFKPAQVLLVLNFRKNLAFLVGVGVF